MSEIVKDIEVVISEIESIANRGRHQDAYRAVCAMMLTVLDRQKQREAELDLPVDAEFIKALLPCTTTHGKRGSHKFRFGNLLWEQCKPGDSIIVWLNGETYPWQGDTRGHFISLIEALGAGI